MLFLCFFYSKVSMCLVRVIIKVFTGIRTISPKENCTPPPIRVKVLVRIKVSFRVGGLFSLGVVVLEHFLPGLCL